jgi:hypothetical protein
MTQELVAKRNVILVLLAMHLILILALLLLTVIRRVFLAMIVNFCLLIVLGLGLLFFIRLNLQFCRYFLIMISVILGISLFLMFIEAFVLCEPNSPERHFVFYVNAPIVIDIAFVVAYFVIYMRYLSPALSHLQSEGPLRANNPVLV